MNFMKSINDELSRISYSLIKHSPTILLVGGVVGIVTSTVMACNKSRTIDIVIADHIEDMEDIKATEHEENINTSALISKKYVETGLELTKMYLPSVMLGTVSIGCILMSHKIMVDRNEALGAAYTTLATAFASYRTRVKERVGEEVERQIYYNQQVKEIEQYEVDEKTGKKTKVKKQVVTQGDGGLYDIFFDELNTNWTRNANRNFFFLKNVQRTFTDKLERRGYVFLNEVYEALGQPAIKEGNVVGWVYDPKDSNKQNYVDFGIMDRSTEETRNFMDGFEPSVLLKFNLHGSIFHEFEMFQNSAFF